MYSLQSYLNGRKLEITCQTKWKWVSDSNLYLHCRLLSSRKMTVQKIIWKYGIIVIILSEKNNFSPWAHHCITQFMYVISFHARTVWWAERVWSSLLDEKVQTKFISNFPKFTQSVEPGFKPKLTDMEALSPYLTSML